MGGLAECGKGFLRRYVEVVKEGHSVFGMLPGCYDGWLLDSDGTIPDPYTRTERALGLAMQEAVNFLMRYWRGVVQEAAWCVAVKGYMWGPLAKGFDFLLGTIVGQCASYLFGPARCKAILQNDWDRLDKNDPATEWRRLRAAGAKIWAGTCTALAVVLFAATRHTARTQQCISAWLRCFLFSTFITEPLLMFFLLSASFVFRCPVSGISFKKVDHLAKKKK